MYYRTEESKWELWGGDALSPYGPPGDHVPQEDLGDTAFTSGNDCWGDSSITKSDRVPSYLRAERSGESKATGCRCWQVARAMFYRTTLAFLCLERVREKFVCHTVPVTILKAAPV